MEAVEEMELIPATLPIAAHKRWTEYVPGNIAHSLQHRSVLLREAILGAADKLIFVYNLSQKIQMIG